MHERDKAAEAEFFLTLMEERSNSAKEFQHCLSAFVSSARSGLQYALEEARSKNQQSWYENAMRSSPILTFFRDKRNINIHERPLALMQQTTLTETVHVNISESLLIEVTREDGTSETREIANAPAPVRQHSSSRVETQYIFDDWPGTDDVLALSKKYLAELKALIEAGVKAGHITG
jgi:hypothetical protein